MNSNEHSGVIKKAKAVLEGNWNGEYTIPSPTLYPHQWSWDSAFIAIGNSYFSIDRAIKELRHLFNAQWKNGLVPHIVFNNTEMTYFPAGDFYSSSKISNDAPKDHATSSLIQPPVHAIAAYYIYKNSRDNDVEKDEAIKFLQWIFPRLLRFHEYLMKERDV
jgi:mannosylglycerate hydrolase MGH1-like protein